MDTQPLSLDIFSDMVCPWCYIGKRRLETALAQCTDVAVRVRWLPFELNPDLPDEGIDRRTYVENKFGGLDRAAGVYERVRDAGRTVGLELAFDRIARQPNTRDAHRLVAWAQRTQGDAEPLVEALFRAYFVEGRFIGDREVLVAVVREAGFDGDAAQAVLAGDEERASVAAAKRRAYAAGITSVPFFIFGERFAVSGAQPADVLVEAIARASAVQAESAS